MFTVYAISSEARKYIYVGLTSNLLDRIKFHNIAYKRTTSLIGHFVWFTAKIFQIGHRQDYEKNIWNQALARNFCSGWN